jgi:putative ABC transport system permease protein
MKTVLQLIFVITVCILGLFAVYIFYPAIFSDLLAQLRFVIDWMANPTLQLFSFVGVAVPREVAAVLTLGLFAIPIVLFTQSSFTRIGFRNIPRRKLRNGLTVFAIILGVALVVGVNIAFDSAFAQFKVTVNQASGNVDINIRSGLDESFNQDVLTSIRAMEGVADASGRIMGQAVLLELDTGWKAVNIVGLNSTNDFSYLNPDVRITRRLPFITYPLELEVNGTEAVVDANLNYSIGDVIFIYLITDYNQTEQTNGFEQLNLSQLHTFTVVGLYHPKEIGEGEYTVHTINIDLVKAQTIFNRTDQLDNIIIKVTNIEQTDHIVENLRGVIGSTYVITPVKENIISGMAEAFTGFQSGLQIMSILSLCVAVIIILNTIYMNVSERTYEIGTLRSVGSSQGQVFWLFFSESLTLGFIGVVIGLILGIPLAKAFMVLSSALQMTLMPPAMTFVVTPWHIILGVITGLASTIVGGLFPSILASRMNVIQALRPSIRKAGTSKTPLKLIAVGLPLTIIGIIIYLQFNSSQTGSGLLTAIYPLFLVVPFLMAGMFLLTAGLLGSANKVIESLLIAFGMTRKIISRNLNRNLTRSTVSFTLIAMTLSFVVVMAGAQVGVLSGLEDVITSFYSADLTISSNTLIPRTFADDLTSIDDHALISHVAPALIIPQRMLLMTPEINVTSMLLVIDPVPYSAVMSMTFSEETPPEVLTELNTVGTIILTAPLAESLNVGVGSIVKLQTLSEDASTTMREYRVIAIAVGTILEWEHGLYSSPLSEACYISYQSLPTALPDYDNEANLFFLKAKSNQNIAHINTRIKDLYSSKYPLSILTVNDALEPATAGINETFIILNAVVLFAVVNAAIGVAAIMIMNVSERRREIGILRSQGMSNFQVILTIVGEAIVISSVGFLIGTISGLLLHRVMVSYMRLTGFPIPYIIPVDAIALSLILALVSSVISSAYPAYRASKLNIIEALRRLV